MAHKASRFDATDLLDVCREWLQDAPSLGYTILIESMTALASIRIIRHIINIFMIQNDVIHRDMADVFRYSAPSIIRKSSTSIIRKIKHIHWVLGKLSVYLVVRYVNRFTYLTTKYTDSFPNTQ